MGHGLHIMPASYTLDCQANIEFHQAGDWMDLDGFGSSVMVWRVVLKQPPSLGVGRMGAGGLGINVEPAVKTLKNRITHHSQQFLNDVRLWICNDTSKYRQDSPHQASLLVVSVISIRTPPQRDRVWEFVSQNLWCWRPEVHGEALLQEQHIKADQNKLAEILRGIDLFESVSHALDGMGR